MPRLTDPFTWAAELVDKGFSIQDALRKVRSYWDDGQLGSDAATDGQVLVADGSGGASWETKISQCALSSYDAQPARSAESNIHGGLLALSTADTLSSGSPINVTKGIGKLMFVVQAGTDVDGTLTITEQA